MLYRILHIMPSRIRIRMISRIVLSGLSSLVEKLLGEQLVHSLIYGATWSGGGSDNRDSRRVPTGRRRATGTAMGDRPWRSTSW